MPLRKMPLLTTLATTAALAAGAPAADAASARVSDRSAIAGFPGSWVSGPCSTGAGAVAGAVAGNEFHVCIGAGLSFVGPAVGQIATVIGPTIISPGFTGRVIVSAGGVGVVR